MDFQLLHKMFGEPMEAPTTNDPSCTRGLKRRKGNVGNQTRRTSKMAQSSFAANGTKAACWKDTESIPFISNSGSGAFEWMRFDASPFKSSRTPQSAMARTTVPSPSLGGVLETRTLNKLIDDGLHALKTVVGLSDEKADKLVGDYISKREHDEDYDEEEEEFSKEELKRIYLELCMDRDRDTFQSSLTEHLILSRHTNRNTPTLLCTIDPTSNPLEVAELLAEDLAADLMASQIIQEITIDRRSNRRVDEILERLMKGKLCKVKNSEKLKRRWERDLEFDDQMHELVQRLTLPGIGAWCLHKLHEKDADSRQLFTNSINDAGGVEMAGGAPKPKL
ncbi:hypothetical protein HDV05_001821 [Chytridiales sp. JEL 0842]|nr:hypothetical protein HDV05_001821 [Chytridiales sp. JEL 0842]